MAKVFLYDPAETTKDTLAIIKRKGYTCVELTDDPDVFWNTVENLGEGDVLALLSHGNANGPSDVTGTEGDDIDMDRFCEAMTDHNIELYLLSCNTGQDPCGETLSDNGVRFVAPKGCAVFTTVGTDQVLVYSKSGGEYKGWSGPLAPTRDNKSLSLP
ncbi:MAG TPA: hypothetical protein VHA52_03190 [Candidatus Babeliaceae bacterium]|nr:hypothetical protein [Candidatus Babeliaceae bacterium]HVZ96675.1 hypothetical protein [Chitinophagaceae bacterium]